MSPEVNPYAPPKHDGPTSTGDPALEAIRREHINAETNVKTIGILLYLGALSSIGRGLKSLEVDPLGGLISIALGVAIGLGGYWLRRLDSRGRLTYTVVTALSLVISLALGELWGAEPALMLIAFGWPAILLAVLWVEKSSTVMSPHYRDVVIPATPHVTRKTSPLVIVLGVILLALFVLAVVVAMRG